MELNKIENSKNITAATHCNGSLFVQFGGGGLYEYKEVPFEIYNEFIASESKGKFIHAHIKGKYECIKL